MDRTHEPAEAIWKVLGPFFAERGYTLWQHCYFFMTTASKRDVVPNGYMYASPYRAFEKMSGSIQGVLAFEYRVSSLTVVTSVKH